MAGHADSDALRSFVDDAKRKGLSDAAIERILRFEGWSDRKIARTLVAYDVEEFGLAPPQRGGRAESAREAFFYLLSFAFLGMWSAGLVWLGDRVFERAFADPTAYSSFTNTAQDMAGQLATILIALPLYLLMNVLLGREIAARPETLESGVRKWLTYVALVIAACTLVGDAVWFLTGFLSGDLTAEAVSMMALLLVIAGGILTYYLTTIRADRLRPAFSRWFAVGAIVLAGAFVVAGFTTVGTPAYERAFRDDARRTNDLSALSMAVRSWWQAHRRLPEALRQLPQPLPLADPMTGIPYAYRRTGPRAYELCATFEAATPPSSAAAVDDWRHPAGHDCFAQGV